MSVRHEVQVQSDALVYVYLLIPRIKSDNAPSLVEDG